MLEKKRHRSIFLAASENFLGTMLEIGQKIERRRLRVLFWGLQVFGDVEAKNL